MRPVIAVPCYSAKRAGALAPIYAANQAYIQAIEEAGGAPVLVPLYAQADTLATLRGRFDGLLLTGGGDVDPARYRERAIPETQPPSQPRDEVELAIVGDALAERIPVFGICRGIQLLNVARGGTLYQDIRVQLPGARNHNLTNRVRGAKTHPIEIAGFPFAMAVQFHPERMYTIDPVMRRLFAAFVAACRDGQRDRDRNTRPAGVALAATR